METKNSGLNPIKVMVLIFVLLSAFFIAFRGILAEKGVDSTVLIAGNIILFLVGIFTIRNGLKAVDNPNPHVFVRAFYAGFIIRLFVCAIAAFLYIYINDGKVEKTSLFACMGIYILYNVVEVSALKNALRNNKNA